MSARGGGALRFGLCAATAGVLSCGQPDRQLTYEDDIAPLFDARCTGCHHTGAFVGLDLQAPFAPGGEGLLDKANTWAEAYPGLTPERIVLPGNAAESFLIQKLQGPAALPPEGGSAMPLELPRLTDEELSTVRDWIAAGATEEDYQARIVPIFGIPSLANAGKCAPCHTPGTPDAPDLTSSANLVGVRASYRTDRTLVVPGAPDESFLVAKLEAAEPTSEVGSPMPYRWDPLTPAEVELVQRWIAEGAKP